MPADLLLPVEGDSYVDRERALAGELGGGLEEEVRVALVVDRAARVEVAVADLRLEGRRVPEIERRRRLDVGMAGEDHRWRGRAAVRGRNLAGGGRRAAATVGQERQATSLSRCDSARA